MTKTVLTSIWIVLAAGLTVAMPGVAVAAKDDEPSLGKIKTRSATSPAVAGSGAIASATAVCPKKSRVIGGGFQAPAPAGGTGLVLYESQRASPRSWRISTQLLGPDPTPAFDVTAHAYCSKKTPKSKVVSSTVATPANSNGTFALATCPDGRTAIGGGFSFPPPIVPAGGGVLNLPSDSNPVGTESWQARVVSGPYASSLTSYVYCARNKQAPDTSALTGQSVLAQNLGEIASGNVSCPRDQQGFAGGFTQGGGNGNNLLFPYESLRVGKAWRVAAFHGGATPSTLSVHALCA